MGAANRTSCSPPISTMATITPAVARREPRCVTFEDELPPKLVRVVALLAISNETLSRSSSRASWASFFSAAETSMTGAVSQSKTTAVVFAVIAALTALRMWSALAKNNPDSTRSTNTSDIGTTSGWVCESSHKPATSHGGVHWHKSRNMRA